MSDHKSGCKCFACGGGAQDFLPVDLDFSIYECEYCGNWYKSKPDGTIEYPTVHDAVEAGIKRRKRGRNEKTRCFN